MKALILLAAVQRAFGQSSFTVKKASEILSGADHAVGLLMSDAELAAKDPMLLCLRIKPLSNDMRRLHFMDWL